MAAANATETAMWDTLQERYTRWLGMQSPVYLREFRDLRQHAGETVAAYCDRANALVQRLSVARLRRSSREVLDQAVDGLVAERPAWRDHVRGAAGAICRQLSR